MDDKSAFPRKVRIKDIADLAGVSRMAVTQALNQRQGGSVRISPATRDRIVMLAKEMNYKPNLAARQLSCGHSRIIGYILDSHSEQDWAECMAEVDKVLTAADYHVQVGILHEDIGAMEKQLDDFYSRGVDGIICSSHTYLNFNEQTMTLFDRFQNKVFIQTPVKPDSVSYVSQDEETGIRILTERLLKSGRSKPLLLNMQISDWQHHIRIRTFSETLKKFKLPCPKNRILLEPYSPRFLTENGCNEFVDRILLMKPDSLIVYRDYAAIMLIKMLKRRGIRVPDDIAVVCNRHTCYCDINDPTITSLEYHFGEIGRQAANLLLDFIRQPDNEPREIIKRIISPVIVEGESG